MYKLLYNPSSKRYSVKRRYEYISKNCKVLASNSQYRNMIQISNHLNDRLPQVHLNRMISSPKKLKYALERQSDSDQGNKAELHVLLDQHKDGLTSNNENKINELNNSTERLNVDIAESADHLKNKKFDENLQLDFQENGKIIKDNCPTDNELHDSTLTSDNNQSEKISTDEQKSFDKIFNEEIKMCIDNLLESATFGSDIFNLSVENSDLLTDQRLTSRQNVHIPDSVTLDQVDPCKNTVDVLPTALINGNKDSNANLIMNLPDKTSYPDDNFKSDNLGKSETQHKENEKVATKLSTRPMDQGILDIFNDKELIAHNQTESRQYMKNTANKLSSDHTVLNNEIKGRDHKSEKQCFIENAFLPEDMTEILTVYDSEKDMLAYSSNYEISDQLNAILAYQLDGGTVDVIRDDIQDGTEDSYRLSPVTLRPRPVTNYLFASESLNEDSDLPPDKYTQNHLTTSNYAESSFEDPDVPTPTINVENQTEILFTHSSNNETENDNTSDDQQLDLEIMKKIDLTTQKGSCDSSKLIVQQSNIPRWKKNYSCPFCHKIIVGQLPRHIKTVHRNLEDVMKLNNTAKGSAERKEILTVLRNHGTFTHNSNELYNNGQLIVSRRPKDERAATSYITCTFCLGTYVKSNARKHILKCRKKHGTENLLQGQRIYYVMGKSIESRMHSTANDILRLVVFPVLQDDDIVRLIRYDWLIILYGNKLCIKYTPHYQHNMVRARLRLIGRFLFAAMQINSTITDLAALFYPKHIETVIKAIGQVANINYLKNSCDNPAVALNLVTYIRQIAVILETEYVVKENEDLQKQVSNFLKVYNCEMGIAVNKIASESQAKMRRHKVIVLPVTDDIQKLIVYIKTQKEICFKILKKTFDYQSWLTASKLVAAYLLVFNRRRVGDVQNMTLDDVGRLQSIDKEADKEEYNALDEDGKEIAASYNRIEIRGKLNRDVAVIASNTLVEEIRILIENRERANIPEDNEFVFALPNGVNERIRVLNLCAVMRDLAVSCGAEKPELLRGTQLRKHIATKCIEFELSDNALSDLTKHMGHSEKIHKDIYQKPIKSKTLVQVTKLLHAVHGSMNDDDIEKEDIYTNDRTEYVEYGSSKNVSAESLSSSVPSGSNVVYNDDPPCTSSNIPSGTQLVFDGILPCASSANSSLKIGESVNILNQSTPNNKPPVNVESEICTMKKKAWSTEEKRIIFTEFKQHIIAKTLPSLPQIDELKAKYPCFNDRKRDTIKTWISNQYKKKTDNALNQCKGIKMTGNEKVNFKLKNIGKKIME